MRIDDGSLDFSQFCQIQLRKIRSILTPAA